MSEKIDFYPAAKNLEEIKYVYLLDEDAVNEVIDQIHHLITVYRSILDARKLQRSRPMLSGDEF